MTRTNEKAAVPRLRFKGCEGAWVSRKFESCFSLGVARNTYSRADLSESGTVKNIHYGDVLIKYGSVLDVSTAKIPFVASPHFQVSVKNRLQDGDVVMADTAEDETAGKVVEIRNAQKVSVVAGLHTIVLRPTEEFQSGFLGYYLNSAFHRQLIAVMQGTKVLSINKSSLSSMLVESPPKNDQFMLGKFFGQIDFNLSHCEKKISYLRQLKRAMLVKMFPRPGQCVPEIRFKGFDGKWEESLLSRYLTVSDSVNVDDAFDANDVLSVSGEYGVVNQILFQGRSFAGASLKNYHVLRYGQVTYTKSPLKQCPYGIVKTNKGADGIVSSLYGVYNAKSGVDAEFVQVYFDNHDRLNAYLRPLVNKGAKNTLLISDENALTGEVCFPSFEEQRKIAAFFRNLDRLIGAAEKKVAKLKQVKASLLERMFA